MLLTPTVDSVVSRKTPAAEQLLASSERLSSLAEHVARVLREAIEDGALVIAVTLDAAGDPELPSWTELVFDVEIGADFAEAMQWQKQISEKRANLNRALSETERSALAQSIGVHVHPTE
jgi:hypothetical protein